MRERAQRRFFWVEHHLHYFGVTGCFAADLLIRRMGDRATHVATGGGVDAFELSVSGFDAPKATRAECDDFGSFGDFGGRGRLVRIFFHLFNGIGKGEQRAQ